MEGGFERRKSGSNGDVGYGGNVYRIHEADTADDVVARYHISALSANESTFLSSDEDVHGLMC